jgi:predicted nucleic acid-binding Zn ribbon protein|tara:strand:- start:935 stop:1165 length:231 start_codon:yes stop_codon:yes gene_type:complete
MPLYEFKDTNTGETFDKMLKIAERAQYLEDNPHLQTVVSAPRIVTGVGAQIKTSSQHKELIKEIKKNHPKNTINDH